MWPYNYRPPTTARPSPRAADDNATLIGDTRSTHFPESPPATGDELPSHASSALDNATTAPGRPSAGEVDGATIHGGTQSTQLPQISPATDNRPAAPEPGGNTNDSADTLVPRSRLQRTRDRIFRRRNQRRRRQTPREDDPQTSQPAQPPQDNDEAKPGRFRRWARRFSLKKASTVVLDNVDSSIAPPDDA